MEEIKKGIFLFTNKENEEVYLIRKVNDDGRCVTCYFGIDKPNCCVRDKIDCKEFFQHPSYFAEPETLKEKMKVLTARNEREKNHQNGFKTDRYKNETQNVLEQNSPET